MLRAFRAWRGFTRAELQELLALTRCWEAPKGTLICEEDSPGGSCFIVARGSVDVSTEVRGQQRRLARLGPGSIFGQISLIDGEPRSATCSAQSDAVLLELEREPCARLLESRSPTALKLLGVLNDGLIRALRGADRRLLRRGEGGFG
jgi:CRP-like cAMP-binding protein